MTISETEPALSSAEVRAAIEKGPHRWVPAGTHRVASWTFGSGPDLVLVHGWPLHSATFRNIVPELSRHFTCHLLDLPAVGWTETGSGSIGLTEHATTLIRFVNSIGLDRFSLLAHDSGAAITRLAAAQLGERVAALIIGNSEIPGHHPWQLRAYLLALKIPFGLQMFAKSLGWRWLRHSALAFGGCFADPEWAEGDFGELFVTPMIDDPDVMAGQSRLLESFDWAVVDGLEDVHRRITSPTCLVWGEDDPFFPLEKAREMALQFAGPTEMQTIARGKLFAHEDFAQAFVDHTLTFLRRHGVTKPASARAARS